MKAALYNTISIDISAGEKYMFRVSGSRILFDGFLKVDISKNEKDVLLPVLTEGENLNVKSYKPEQHFTQPPARYTEASLVKTLEEEGIGRPSTYAPTISTVISRGYVIRDSKQLLPTELGFIVTDLLSEHLTVIK